MAYRYVVQTVRVVFISLFLVGIAAGQSKPSKPLCPADGCNHGTQVAPPAKQEKAQEPMDVPPIQEEYGNPGHTYCDMGQCSFIEGSDSFNGDPGTRRTRLTCADKTRFLMTAEDGSKHCISLPSAAGQTR